MAQLLVPTTLSCAVERDARAMLARVNVEMKSDADRLEIKALDLRVPGAPSCSQPAPRHDPREYNSKDRPRSRPTTRARSLPG